MSRAKKTATKKAPRIEVARGMDGTIGTAHEIYVDGRLFVHADAIRADMVPPHSAPALPASTSSSGPTLDEVLAAFGRFEFMVHTEKREDTYRVQVFELTGDNLQGLGASFFKVKEGATVLEALRRIAHYHTELARLFEAGT